MVNLYLISFNLKIKRLQIKTNGRRNLRKEAKEKGTQ